MSESLRLGFPFFKKLILTVSSRAGSAVLGILTSILVARTLTVAEQGDYAVYLATSLLGVQFLSLGINAANTYFTARMPETRAHIISNSFVISIILGLVWTVFVLLCEWLGMSLFAKSELVFLSLAFVPLELAFSFLHSISLGLDNLKYFNTFDIVRKIFNLTLIFLVLQLTSITPEKVAACVIFSNAICLGIISFVLMRGVLFHASIDFLKKSFRYGFWIYLGSVFGFFILRFNLILVHKYLSNEDSGYFSVSLALADAVSLLPATLGMVAFSAFVKEKNIFMRWQHLLKIVYFISAFMLCVTLFVFWLAPQIVTLLYGSKFIASAEPLRYMLPGLFCLSILTLFQNFLGAFESPVLTWIGPAAGLAVSLVLNFILIPTQGLLGAALANSAAYVVWLILVVSMSYSKVKHAKHRDI